MSREIIRQQAAALKRAGSNVRTVDEGENVIVILEAYTPPGDNYEPRQLDALAFIVPAPYPDASPDPSGFFVRPASIIVASTRSSPQSTSDAMLLGIPHRKFSWKPKTFQFDGTVDTLETHLATIERRFLLGT
ncbi:MAG: hypothetical protein IBJ03_03280 [Gemmatimonadaceae bacterium]|nr:hypothetical protein [Gemmatimonadaceae bacterium]